MYLDRRIPSYYQSEKDFANQNPYSTVYKLVTELFNLEKVVAEENNEIQ